MVPFYKSSLHLIQSPTLSPLESGFIPRISSVAINKARVKSAIVNEDPGEKERDELKQRIEKLTESVKAANLQAKPASPRHKKSSISPRAGRQNVNERGPEPTAAGPFHGNGRPLQCYKCGGWGHVARECPTAENLDWRGLMWADPTPEKAPGPESTMLNQQ